MFAGISNFVLLDNDFPFTLQNYCVPIFCPAYEIEVDGNCVPLVLDVQANSVQLNLYTNQLPEIIQSNNFSFNIHTYKANKQTWNPRAWVRSLCMDNKWSYISVYGTTSNENNHIHLFHFSFTLYLQYDKGFLFKKMKARLKKCWENKWELLLNGHWHLMSVVIGRQQNLPFPTHETPLWSSSSGIPYAYAWPFKIEKLMFCKQVLRFLYNYNLL